MSACPRLIISRFVTGGHTADGVQHGKTLNLNLSFLFYFSTFVLYQVVRFKYPITLISRRRTTIQRHDSIQIWPHVTPVLPTSTELFFFFALSSHVAQFFPLEASSCLDVSENWTTLVFFHSARIYNSSVRLNFKWKLYVRVMSQIDQLHFLQHFLNSWIYFEQTTDSKSAFLKLFETQSLLLSLFNPWPLCFVLLAEEQK